MGQKKREESEIEEERGKWIGIFDVKIDRWGIKRILISHVLFLFFLHSPHSSILVFHQIQRIYPTLFTKHVGYFKILTKFYRGLSLRKICCIAYEQLEWIHTEIFPYFLAIIIISLCLSIIPLTSAKYIEAEQKERDRQRTYG